MFKRMLMLFAVLAVFQGTARAACSTWEQKKLWLSEWECQKAEGAKKDSWLSAADFLQKKSIKGSGALWEYHYREGIKSWSEGSFLPARNHWVQFMALCGQRCGGENRMKLDEVEPFLAWLESALEDEWREEELEASPALSPAKPEKRPARKIKKARSPAVPRTKESRLFMKRARMAAQAGDFRLAVRMARLSEELDPEWKEPGKWIPIWEKDGAFLKN